MKVAVTVLFALIDMVHEILLSASHPVQLTNTDPVAGAAVSVIAVPLATVSVQSAPQAMPEPVTVPDPVPLLTTGSVEVTGALLSVAVTDLLAVIDMVHDAPLGASHPGQLPNVDPAAAGRRTG